MEYLLDTNSNNQSAFLGRGWGWPVQFDKTAGAVVMVQYEEDIWQSLQILFGTSIRERVMQPGYGCNPEDYVFATMNVSFLSYLENLVQNNVAQSPAGTTAVLSAVALEAYFTGTDLANLESAQINPIKSVPNSGFCVYGVLTTAPGYPNRYINISRTLMKIQHDLQFLTAFAVFQNNNSVLWQNVATVITNYLTQEMQDGLLAGTTPADSFNVICDSTVNTPTTIAAGIINAQVAVAVSAPAEFVVITLSQMATGATTTISS